LGLPDRLVPDTAEELFKTMLDRNVPLMPLDVAGLVQEERESARQWREIRHYLTTPLLDVFSEQLFVAQEARTFVAARELDVTPSRLPRAPDGRRFR
jgi:hypothetical protein